MLFLVVALSLLGQFLASTAQGAVVEKETPKLAKLWRDKHTYYHPSLNAKMEETLEGRCLRLWKKQTDGTIVVPQSADDLFAASFPVSREIYEWWMAIPVPKQMRVEPYLCAAPYERRRPLWNNPACQLPHYMHPSAPRCQTSVLKWICDKASVAHNKTDLHHRFVLPEANHATADTPPQPWLITVRRAIVSMCGHISANCGLVRTTANCMATGYRGQAQLFAQKCPTSLFPSDAPVGVGGGGGGDAFKCKTGAPFSELFVFHKRVFVVAEVDDTYSYHVHLEIMPRIVYHLQFLKENPDVKILIGCDTKKNPEVTLAGLKSGLEALQPFMDMVGLSMMRLVVHTHVSADEVYLPMEGACQDPVYNTWQILTMRRLFMSQLGLSDDRAPSAQPVMTLIKRSANARATRNGFDSVRQWSDGFAGKIVAKLKAAFPKYRVVLFSDRNETLMRCHSCQIRAAAETDVLIGVHGAGLANMLYMKPNSAVVELAPYGNDGRCILGGGPFSRIAAVMGHNYLIHHPRNEEYRWIPRESVSEFDVDRFVTHIQSFVNSL